MYQLFRQQALAVALETEFDVVISSVFADSRNDEIRGIGREAGLGPLPEGWCRLFPNLPFVWLNHNDWYEFVKLNDRQGEWADWLNYIGPRYFQLRIDHVAHVKKDRPGFFLIEDPDGTQF